MLILIANLFNRVIIIIQKKRNASTHTYRTNHIMYCWQFVVCGVKSVQAPKIIAQNTRQGHYFIFRFMTIVPTTAYPQIPVS